MVSPFTETKFTNPLPGIKNQLSSLIFPVYLSIRLSAPTTSQLILFKLGTYVVTLETTPPVFFLGSFRRPWRANQSQLKNH